MRTGQCELLFFEMCEEFFVLTLALGSVGEEGSHR